jgi:hypothetical protein
MKLQSALPSQARCATPRTTLGIGALPRWWTPSSTEPSEPQR